jgi:hypothetical protein
MMGDYHVRFRERFRGETPLYLLDFRCNTMISNAQARVWQPTPATSSHRQTHAFLPTRISQLTPVKGDQDY